MPWPTCRAPTTTSSGCSGRTAATSGGRPAARPTARRPCCAARCGCSPVWPPGCAAGTPAIWPVPIGRAGVRCAPASSAVGTPAYCGRSSAAIPQPTSAGSNSSSVSQLCRLRKKRRRDRLIRLARGRPGWTFGFADAVWFSRFARPALHAWTSGRPLRLGMRAAGRDDPGPKALACYGLWLPGPERMLLRFVAGRPVSGITRAFLAWVADHLAAEGVRVLALVWDNAPWHVSREVRAWIAAHNRRVKAAGRGCRLLVCRLPSKSPWLNPIEPRRAHGKRAVVEPDRKLAGQELRQRLCDHYRCPLVAEPLAQQDA